MEQAEYGIMFHHLYRDGVPTGQGAITSGELQQIIDHVGRDNLLSASEWVERSDQGALEPHHRCFDDALYYASIEVRFRCSRRMSLRLFGPSTCRDSTEIQSV